METAAGYDSWKLSAPKIVDNPYDDFVDKPVCFDYTHSNRTEMVCGFLTETDPHSILLSFPNEYVRYELDRISSFRVNNERQHKSAI